MFLLPVAIALAQNGSSSASARAGLPWHQFAIKRTAHCRRGRSGRPRRCPSCLPAAISSVIPVPGQQYAIVETTGAAQSGVATLSLSGLSAVTPIASTFPHSDRTAFSPSGSVAVLYSASTQQAQVITGLPSSPQLSLTVDLSPSALPLTCLAVSDDAQAILAGVSDGTRGAIWMFVAGKAGQQITTAGLPSGLRFFSASENAVAADKSWQQILLLPSGAAPQILAGAVQGIRAPADLEISTDQQTIWVVDTNADNGTPVARRWTAHSMPNAAGKLFSINVASGAVAGTDSSVAAAAITRARRKFGFPAEVGGRREHGNLRSLGSQCGGMAIDGGKRRVRIRIQSFAKIFGLIVLASFFAPASWAQLMVTAACPAPVAYQNQPYSFPITVTGAAEGPINFTLNGTTLPTGLSLNSPGTISGTPMVSGTFPISVKVEDSSNAIAYYNCNIIVQQVLAVTSTCPIPNAVLGVPYSYTFTGVGGQTPYTWQLETEAPIPGLNFNAATGVLSGTPTEVGTYDFGVLLTDYNFNYAPISCSLSVVLSQITAACPAASGNIGVPYSFSISVAGAQTFQWALASGSLPPGLTLNPNTGLISGTPTTLGNYPFSVNVSIVDTQFPPVTYSCSITIAAPLIVITTACPITTIPTTLTATGGSGSYTFSIIGFLPASLSLTGNVISGSLTAPAGTYGFTLQATDGQQTVQKACSIVISPPALQITSGCPTSSAPQGSPFSFTLVAAGGLGGYVWSIQPALPTGLTLNGNVISGTPTGALGTVAFTLQVTSGTLTTSIPCSVTVTAPRLVLASACPANGAVGVAFAPIVLTATGGLGSGTYTFSVTGSLPPGVTFSGNTISGTPTVAGNYVFSFSAVSGTQTAVSAGCSITIAPAALQLTTNCPTVAFTVGSAIMISFAPAGGQAPFSYNFSGPSWLTLNTLGAVPVVSGTPGAADTGVFPISLTITDATQATASTRCSLTVNPAALQIGGSCPANPIAAGAPISIPVNATGGVPPYSWTISGNSTLSILAAQGATNSIQGNAPTTLGMYAFLLTLTDSAKSPSATLSCTLNVQLPALQITGTCPASTLNLPLSLSVPLTATGGQAPYTWKVSGPSWISLSGTTGATTSVTNSSAPTAPGAFTFSVTLTDSASSTPSAFSCGSSINSPTPPAVSVTGLTLQPSLLQETGAGLQLSSPALLPIIGTVTLTFLPNSFGITDNPQVYFDGGSRTATFTIAPGQTSYTLPNVQQGTDAGTIQLQVTDLQQGGVEVLTTPYPTSTLIIPREAPVIATTDVTITNETSTGFVVVISGYSTPRDMQSVTLTFSPAAGATLSGTTSFTENVSTLFSTYYSSAASQLAGSIFTNLQVPVTTTGDVSAIGSVTVTLANSAGNSQAITVTH